MYTIALVTWHKKPQIIIRHFLYSAAYPLEGDYIYIFKGAGREMVGITFRGEFTHDELKVISNKLVAEDFSYYKLSLVEYIDTKKQKHIQAKSLKGDSKNV